MKETKGIKVNHIDELSGRGNFNSNGMYCIVQDSQSFTTKGMVFGCPNCGDIKTITTGNCGYDEKTDSVIYNCPNPIKFFNTIQCGCGWIGNFTNGTFVEYTEGTPFYCQRDIEGESICEAQCEHCQEYYKPLEQPEINIKELAIIDLKWLDERFKNPRDTTTPSQDFRSGYKQALCDIRSHLYSLDGALSDAMGDAEIVATSQNYTTGLFKRLKELYLSRPIKLKRK